MSNKQMYATVLLVGLAGYAVSCLIARKGWPARTKQTERGLDATIADSFPASDPPPF